MDSKHDIFSYSPDTTPIELGVVMSSAWRRDPKTVLFNLARYKFVAKMLSGCFDVAEIGAGDGFGSFLVKAGVCYLTLYDIHPLNLNIRKYDAMEGPLLNSNYNAIYTIDTIEHVSDPCLFLSNIVHGLHQHGKLIIGTPSLESQPYASPPSKAHHINCQTGEYWRNLCSQFFHHVFIFGMNDEVVHTGFLPMAHYIWAVCAEPKGDSK